MDEARSLLWDQRPVPKRGPRPAMSLSAIAGAGVAIADADGLAAVTMQQVATRLGFTKMALYRYVPGKTELVALMVETCLGAPPRREPGGWRQALEGWSLQLFTRLAAHPWAVDATIGARPVGPNELEWMEQAVGALTGTGLDGGEVLDVVVTLTGHVRTIAQQAAAAESGTPELDLSSTITGMVRGREERFPALAAAFASAAASGSHDQALDFGLARILDGVEMLINRRRQQTRTLVPDA